MHADACFTPGAVVSAAVDYVRFYCDFFMCGTDVIVAVRYRSAHAASLAPFAPRVSWVRFFVSESSLDMS